MNFQSLNIKLPLIVLLTHWIVPTAMAEQYKFVALGDTSYEVPDDYPIYRALIAKINQANPKFSIHVGDTKGAGDCGDEFQLGQKVFFEYFAAPLVYAFGNIVMAMHSDIFSDLGRMDGGAFQPILQVIEQGATNFSGQVLVIHGHEHTFIIDKPLRVWDNAATTTVGDNVTRLEVYGWPDMKAVQVSVDTEKAWVFGFEPLYAEQSLSPAFTD